MVKVRVPATTANLGPGFDCLGMALQLYNEITLSKSSEGSLKISCSGPAATENIALDESNLVYRAVAKIFELTGQSSSGLNLHLHLQSPLARGLGSSASAIVGGMFAANEFLGRPLGESTLAWESTQMEGHPDNVIPCLVGGLTASIVLGEQVLVERIVPNSEVTCVVFVPEYELETSKARGVMPTQVTIKDAVFNASRIPFVLSRLQSGNLSHLSEIMDDRLHQPYRISLIKGYREVEQAAYSAGASAVCISGAGPTILAICTSNVASSVAEAGHGALRDLGVESKAHVVLPDNRGCMVI